MSHRSRWIPCHPWTQRQTLILPAWLAARNGGNLLHQSSWPVAYRICDRRLGIGTHKLAWLSLPIYVSPLVYGSRSPVASPRLRIITTLVNLTDLAWPVKRQAVNECASTGATESRRHRDRIILDSLRLCVTDPVACPRLCRDSVAIRTKKSDAHPFGAGRLTPPHTGGRLANCCPRPI